MEYKFRGKRIPDNKWIYGSLMQWPNGECEIVEMSNDNKGVKFMIRPETVGMWTGLKDKKGIEIYQGDKLKGMMGNQESEYRSPIVSTVILKDGGFEVFSKAMSRCTIGRFTWIDAGYYGRKDNYNVIEDLEVVGNIHEVNPTSGKASINNMFIDPNEQKQQEEQLQATEQEAQEKAMESEEEGGSEG